MFKSAESNYTGIKCYENRNLLQKLENQFKGFIEIPLNLSDFISHNQLDMILNNDLISNDNFYFELYDFERLFEEEVKEVEEDISNYISIEEFTEIETSEELQERINDIATENIYSIEVYQYFIISEYDVKHYWSKYTNYPIYYDNDADVYLLGITHWGMSWKYFSTNYKVRHYL